MSLSPPQTHQQVSREEVDLEGKMDIKIDLDDQQTGQGENADSWFSSATNQLLVPAKASVAREWISKQREGLKPWRSFFKTDKFHLPTGVGVAGKRLLHNVELFQSNYMCVFIVLFMYCILTSPMLLIALAACMGLVYAVRVKNVTGHLVIGGKELSPTYQYAAIAALSFPLFYLAGAGSAIFWVIGASIFVIIVHALCYQSEEVPGGEFIIEDV